MKSPLRILLLQVRGASDPMLAHERSCLERRFAGQAVSIDSRNLIAEAAAPSWLDGADALVIGGSGAYSVHDPRSAPWVGPARTLLERALDRSLPGFGICFGHQLLGAHLGAIVEADPSHAEVGTRSFSLTDAGREDAVFGGLPADFRAQTGHSDSVMSVPPGVDLMATSEALETQAFRVRGTRYYTSQFHPDLTGQEARDRFEAYARALHDAGADPPSGDPGAFVAGTDEAATLLGRLVGVVLDERA